MMKDKEIPAETLAFVQRCQAVAGAWALHGHPEFDIVGGVEALLRCWRSLPPLKTQIDRVGASSAILRLAWNVRRQLPRVPPTAPRERLPRTARLALVVRALAARRNQHVSLDILAAWMNVTDSHLSRLIHSEMGLTFPVLVHGLRMVDVVVLLRTSTLSIKEVAAIAGYPQTKTMDRVVRRWLQMSPSDLRAVGLADRPTCRRIAAEVRQFLCDDVSARPAQVADALMADFGLVAQQWRQYTHQTGASLADRPDPDL